MCAGEDVDGEEVVCADKYDFPFSTIGKEKGMVVEKKRKET